MTSSWRSPLRAAVLGAILFAASAAAQEIDPPGAPLPDAPSSEQIEKNLQNLSWHQFRSVVEAVPKLKADVEAYGSLGWHFVEANYTHYRWKKTVDKLDAADKTRLAGLIETARSRQE